MPQKNRKKAASFQPKSNSQPKPLLNRPHMMLAQVASKNGTYTDIPSTSSETIVVREKENLTSDSLTSVISASNSDFRFTTKNAPASEKSEAGQNSGAEHWKTVVQRYIRIFNEAETEQHPYLLLEHVRDEEHQARISKRLERIRERELMRGAWPKLSETKGELVRVYDAGDEVAVMLKLHIKRKIEQGSVMYTDERYEYERLWLKREGDSWVIKRVEPIIYERRPKYGDQSWMPQTSDNEKHGGLSNPSIPYLNNEMLTAFMPSMFRAFHYRRDLAAAYADRWWNEGNPAYELFEVNCTNYVSQCLFAGTAPMNYTGKRASGWWYNGRDNGRELWSYSWAVSQALTNYLSVHRQSGLRAESVATADHLELGDVITYDWAGDGRFQHSTIVTAFDAFGRPLVNANTVASRHRYWDYSDSYAWTPNTKYRFFHIISD